MLKRKDIGEADRLITLFTKQHGKLSASAKGVRKINSRRAGNLEILNHVKILLHQTKGLPIVTEAETVADFGQLKKDLKKLSLVYLVFELVDQFLSEEQENSAIFNLLKDTLEALEKSETQEKAKVFATNFQFKFLLQVGYLPQLHNCVRCNQEIQPETNFLAPNLGGLVDKGCSREVLLSRSLSVDAIKTLRFIEKKSILELYKLSLEKKLLKEVWDSLNFYTTFFLEKDLRTPRFALAVEKLYE